ncbi:hypothetical protein PG989_014985 [Apiospora arundinis]
MAGYDIPDLIDDQELEDLLQHGNFANSEYSDWLNHTSFELDFGTEGVPPVPPDHYYPTPEDMDTYGNVQVENLTANGQAYPDEASPVVIPDGNDDPSSDRGSNGAVKPGFQLCCDKLHKLGQKYNRHKKLHDRPLRLCAAPNSKLLNRLEG